MKDGRRTVVCESGMRQPKWRITSRTLSKAEKAMSVYDDDDDDDDDDDFDNDADRFPIRST